MQAKRWLPMAAFDVTMSLTLQDPESPLYWDTIGGCCATPPCGHVITHETGTRGRAMGAHIGGPKSLHKSRWAEELWCRGGTRKLPFHNAVLMPRLIGMPAPGQLIPYLSRPLDLPRDYAELVWRTYVPEQLQAATAGPSSGSSEPPEGGPARAAGAPSAKSLAKLIGAPSGSTGEAGWHGTAARRRTKALAANIRRLETAPFPREGESPHTPAGYEYDAVYEPPDSLTISASSKAWGFYFRAYVLPEDPVSDLAFQLSMAEARCGRKLEDARGLQAPWEPAEECEALINAALAAQEAAGLAPPGGAAKGKGRAKRNR